MGILQISLSELHLRGNQLTTLPESIENLTTYTLDLAVNQLKLDLEDNQLSKLTKEVEYTFHCRLISWMSKFLMDQNPLILYSLKYQISLH